MVFLAENMSDIKISTLKNENNISVNKIIFFLKKYLSLNNHNFSWHHAILGHKRSFKNFLNRPTK